MNSIEQFLVLLVLPEYIKSHLKGKKKTKKNILLEFKKKNQNQKKNVIILYQKNNRLFFTLIEFVKRQDF